MDITLQIIIKPSTHILTGMKNAYRYRQGDIIDVYRTSKYATLQADGNYLLNSHIGHERFGFVHIKNIPDTLDRARIKRKLLKRIEILDEPVRRCKWHIPPSILPASFKQKLLANKQATVEWTTAKAYIRKKTTPVILDPDQDDITTVLTGGDVE